MEPRLRLKRFGLERDSHSGPLDQQALNPLGLMVHLHAHMQECFEKYPNKLVHAYMYMMLYALWDRVYILDNVLYFCLLYLF